MRLFFGKRPEIEGEDFADETVGVGAHEVVRADSDESVGVRVELVLERNDDHVHAALVVRPVRDVGSNFADVGVVQRSIDLVLKINVIDICYLQVFLTFLFQQICQSFPNSLLKIFETSMALIVVNFFKYFLRIFFYQIIDFFI